MNGFECKYCGCTESYEESRPPHIGVYCKACQKWQYWKKHSTNPKTRDDYRNEYLSKVPATDQQRMYIRNLLKQNPLTKYQATEIIKLLGGETI